MFEQHLIEAISRLTEATIAQTKWLQAHLDCATKHDLGEIRDIMATVNEQLKAFETSFDQIGASVDELVASQSAQATSIASIDSDVRALKDMIDKLNNSPGEFTPADQSLVDNLQAKVGLLSSKTASAAAAGKAIAAAAAALDAQTENAPV